MIDTNATLSDLATTYPGATRVFLARGLDFCCKGRRPLAEACREKSLDPVEIASAIEREEKTAGDLTAWSAEPLDALVRFIVARYHDRLRSEIPELVLMADKVERVHADKGSCPRGLAQHLRSAQAAVIDHLEKEEKVLFPMIVGGHGAMVSGPVFVMEREHDDHGRALARTRELTNDLTPPAEACATWRALYLRLAQLETELMEHIHLENNVLFPRALAA